MDEPDLSGFDRTAYRKSLCGDPDAVIFGIAAQLDFRKGIMVAMEGFSKLAMENNKVYLLIAGTGPEEARLKARAAELGLSNKIIFLGYRTDAYKVIASLDVNILPSLSLEALSYSVIESVFLGVPSIVTNIGGAKEIISASGGGKVIPKNSASAVYKAMKFYADNPVKEISDGEAAKRYARNNLTSRQMADKTYEVYKRA
jgi:glycosyltransferase involved in cell wall biosynthesis